MAVQLKDEIVHYAQSHIGGIQETQVNSLQSFSITCVLPMIIFQKDFHGNVIIEAQTAHRCN